MLHSFLKVTIWMCNTAMNPRGTWSATVTPNFSQASPVFVYEFLPAGPSTLDGWLYGCMCN